MRVLIALSALSSSSDVKLQGGLVKAVSTTGVSGRRQRFVRATSRDSEGLTPPIDGSAVRADGKSSGVGAPTANSHEPYTNPRRESPAGMRAAGSTSVSVRGVSSDAHVRLRLRQGSDPSREATTVIEVSARTISASRRRK